MSINYKILPTYKIINTNNNQQVPKSNLYDLIDLKYLWQYFIIPQIKNNIYICIGIGWILKIVGDLTF